jgi:hypothetical protein
MVKASSTGRLRNKALRKPAMVASPEPVGADHVYAETGAEAHAVPGGEVVSSAHFRQTTLLAFAGKPHVAEFEHDDLCP